MISIAHWIDRGRTFLTVELWSADSSKLFVVRVLQFSIMVVQGFVRDQLLLRASALTYFTVLSIVPMIAVAVSIASAVGVGSGDFVDWILSTLAAGSPGAEEYIRPLVEKANFAGLGTLGAAILFVTTVLAISNVETALNNIWGVSQGRSWARRFADYLAVIVVGPLLGGVALSLTATLQNEWIVARLLELPLFATLYDFGLSQAPAVMLSLAFAFLYGFMPNTKVAALSAILGGLFAGFMLTWTQQIYVSLGVGVTRANLFFGSFALLAMLFAWLYILWAIVLLGAEIAFAHQNLAHYRREVRGAPAGPAEREAIGLRIAIEVGRRFRDGAPSLDSGALADALDVPVRTVRAVTARLLRAGILSVRLDDERDSGLQLGRPAETIHVVDVLMALRGDREAAGGNVEIAGLVATLLEEIEEGAVKGGGGRTLGDLLASLPHRSEVDPPEARG